MIILPAIDLYGGKVVRLHKGDFAAKKEYGDDPIDTAKRFRDMGSKYLHIVDLEGAEVGHPKHLHVLSEISKKLDMDIEFGGGLRTKDAIRAARDAGADSLMVGSIMFKTPESPRELFDAFGIVLTPSIDVRDDKVVMSGWKKDTNVSPSDMLDEMLEIGYTKFLVTAVHKDGTLEGPDFDLYRSLVRDGASIIAAGGVTTLENAVKLSHFGVYGAVVGKAIYEGRFDLARALREL